MNAGWSVSLLGDAFKTVTGNTPPKSATHYYGRDMPLIKPPELTDGEILEASDGLSAAGAQVARVAPAGSVLVSCIGNLGKIGLATRPLAFNQQINAIYPDAALALPQFVFYQTLSPQFKDQLHGLAAGTTVPIVNKSRFNGIEIALAPLEEQQRIVALLDEAFEGLARARVNAEANLQNARELFESFLNDVFRAGSWPSKTLNEISENLDRVRVPITKGDRQAGDIPYYGASGVVDYVADYLFDEDLLLVSEDGANLLARTYPIAFSISGKTWVNNHAHVLRFSDTDTQEFVRLYLNSLSLEPFVSGMAQPKLNQAQLNRIPIPFPSAAERTQIVAKAELFSADTANLQQRYEDAVINLDDLRQSLLHKAFAGELT